MAPAQDRLGRHPDRASRSSDDPVAAACQSSGGPGEAPAAPVCAPVRSKAPPLPVRPPLCWSPMWMTPRRKVPVVSTAAPQWIIDPSAHKTPARRPSRPISRSSTEPARTVSPGVSASIRWIACRYSARSAWARGPRTAGPLLRFSSLKWMPAASAARPISPSSASTSRTRCPLPIPPIDGLQDISPIVFRRWVSNSVRAPMRAAAAAASHPACPPPTTTTSKRSTTRSHLVTCAPGGFIAPMEFFSVHHLIQLLHAYGNVVLGVVVGLESLGLPLPGETLLIAAAVYAGTTHQLNIAFVILSAAVGAIVGQIMGYAIGWGVGFRLLRRYGRYIGLTDRRLAFGRALFRRHGEKVVFAARFIVAAAYPGGIAGWGKPHAAGPLHGGQCRGQCRLGDTLRLWRLLARSRGETRRRTNRYWHLCDRRCRPGDRRALHAAPRAQASGAAGARRPTP